MKRKIEIVLQHGWAFDKTCWRAWLPHLRENQDCEISIQTPDRGYFGDAKPVFEFENTNSIKVVVAHSLGLHLLPLNVLQAADLLVLSASFSHFHIGSALEQKRSRKTINLMLHRLLDDPMGVLNEFYSNCYHPLLTSHTLLMRNIQKLDLELLTEDLKLLNSNTFDLKSLSRDTEIMLVHGTDDIIVPISHSHQMSEQMDKSSVTLFEGAGHSLPLTHVAPVWISLRNTLRHLLRIEA